MNNGALRIAVKRQRQIDKHGFTGGHHATHPEWYDKKQLIEAAKLLTEPDLSLNVWFPEGWNRDWFYELCSRPYEERLEIAGSFIASELDRMSFLDNLKKHS